MRIQGSIRRTVLAGLAALLGTSIFSLAFGGVFLLDGAGVEAAPGTYHEDARLGYKIRYPKGWRHIAMGADEKWIAAKFLSDKSCIFNDKEAGWTFTHKPVMQVIVFIDEVVKKRGIETEEADDGSVWISLNNPYKDYEDFLQQTYRGGGWYISEEEEGELKGVKVTKYEIKVEKLTNTGPKRIVTWVFHTDEVDYAVQFEILESYYKKFKGDVGGCLKSFKLIERTEGSLTGPVTTGKKIRLKNEDDLTPEERTDQRKETEAAAHKKAIDALPDDWKVKVMGRFLVLNHADEKYAKKTVAHAEAIWKWMDKNFDYIGTGEYVRRPILRICKDRDEESAFRSGTSWSWGESLEIVTHQDKGAGAMSWELEYVNTKIFDIWFSHRNSDLRWAMPWWLSSGFRQVLGTARAKGSRLEFKVDDWEREGLRVSAKKNELTTPKVLVMLPKKDFYENQNRQWQSSAFIRFLLEAKGKKTRQVLRDYLMNLQDVVAETQAKEKKESEEKMASMGSGGDNSPETEEEEEEAFKKRQESYSAKELEFMQEVFDRTFGDWSEKDWKRLQTLFYKSI